MQLICDYWEMSCKLCFDIDILQFKTYLENKGFNYIGRSKNYNYQFQNDYFYLMFYPFAEFIPYDNVIVKINNWCLYSYSVEELKRMFFESFKGWIDFKYFNRFDIACDVNESKVDYIGKKIINNKYNFNRKTRFEKPKDVFESVYIGSGSTNVSLVIYDKVKEVLHSGKQYILDYLEYNGMNTDTVTRYEFKLKNINELQDFADFDIYNLSDEKIKCVFMSLNSKFSYKEQLKGCTVEKTLLKNEAVERIYNFKRVKYTPNATRTDKMIIKHYLKNLEQLKDKKTALNAIYDYYNSRKLTLFLHKDDKNKMYYEMMKVSEQIEQEKINEQIEREKQKQADEHRINLEVQKRLKELLNNGNIDKQLKLWNL